MQKLHDKIKNFTYLIISDLISNKIENISENIVDDFQFYLLQTLNKNKITLINELNKIENKIFQKNLENYFQIYGKILTLEIIFKLYAYRYYYDDTDDEIKIYINSYIRYFIQCKYKINYFDDDEIKLDDTKESLLFNDFENKLYEMLEIFFNKNSKNDTDNINLN